MKAWGERGILKHKNFLIKQPNPFAVFQEMRPDCLIIMDQNNTRNPCRTEPAVVTMYVCARLAGGRHSPRYFMRLVLLSRSRR